MADQSEIDPKKTAMIDMYKQSEDDRIQTIIAHAYAQGGKIAFMVDADTIERGKADRYVQKIRALCPPLREVSRREHHPVPNVVTVFMQMNSGAAAQSASSQQLAHRAPILDQLEGQWEKIVAALVWKLGNGHVTLTMKDLTEFPVDRVFLTHGHRDSIEFKLVTEEEAKRIVEHDEKTNTGRA
jgi:hypothetical protein